MKNFAWLFGIGLLHLAVVIGKLQFAVSSEVEKCYCGCDPTGSLYDQTGTCTDGQVGCGIQVPGSHCFGLCLDSDDTEYCKILHATFHFNLTICFRNLSLELTLKITWSLAKIKVAIKLYTI